MTPERLAEIRAMYAEYGDIGHGEIVELLGTVGDLIGTRVASLHLLTVYIEGGLQDRRIDTALNLLAHAVHGEEPP